MKVSSPVGEFPYEIERIRVESRRLVLHGRMGAWPSRVELDGGDLAALVRLLLRAPFAVLRKKLWAGQGSNLRPWD